MYLELLKRCLLNEIYLDDELRLAYLRDCLSGNEVFDYAVYHDIRTERSEAYAALRASREIGRFPDRDIHKSGFSHTMIGRRGSTGCTNASIASSKGPSAGTSWNTGSGAVGLVS
jgi:hypothetical protein